MSERRMIGFIVRQIGAPGPASGVSYDIKVNESNQSATYTGVVPSTPRPPDEIDVGVIAANSAVDVWDIDGVLHFMFTEYPHTAECSGPPPAPLIDRIIAAIGTATPAQKAVIRSALGVKVI